jgi:DNA-binding NtrC family response regulator
MPAPVVVVHDEALTRDLALSTLRAAGFDTVAFRDPMTALDAVEADGRARVLVTKVDFGSGVLNGVALARMLKHKRKGIEAIFLATPETRSHAEDEGQILLLPLQPQALAEAVGRILAS